MMMKNNNTKLCLPFVARFVMAYAVRPSLRFRVFMKEEEKSKSATRAEER
jgi:hypothetical protein